MDNFQHNWPPFWGYIFYFPLTPVAHLVSLPHTRGNLYGHLLPWQREAVTWVFYYLLGGEQRSTSAPCPWVRALSKRPLRPLRHWKVHEGEIYVLLLSASQQAYARLYGGHLRQMLLRYVFACYERKHTSVFYFHLLDFESCSKAKITFSQLHLAVTNWTECFNLIWPGFHHLWFILIGPDQWK